MTRIPQKMCFSHHFWLEWDCGWSMVVTLQTLSCEDKAANGIIVLCVDAVGC